MERHPSPEVHGLRSARFRAVGDLMIHRKQLEIARQPDGTYDFHPQFALIAEALGRADYTIANLETTIGKPSRSILQDRRQLCNLLDPSRYLTVMAVYHRASENATESR